jgi:hypothetical protein
MEQTQRAQGGDCVAEMQVVWVSAEMMVVRVVSAEMQVVWVSAEMMVVRVHGKHT